MLTASRVSWISYTIQGCRPTSVAIHPVSSATTAASPETPTARGTTDVCGISRLRHQDQPEPSGQPEQREPDPDHGVVRQVHDVDRWPQLLRHAVQADHLRVRVVRHQQGQPVRDLDRALQLVVDVDAAERQRCPRLGLGLRLHGGQLHRLVSATTLAIQSPTPIWIGAGDRWQRSAGSTGRTGGIGRGGRAACPTAYTEATLKPVTITAARIMCTVCGDGGRVEHGRPRGSCLDDLSVLAAGTPSGCSSRRSRRPRRTRRRSGTIDRQRARACAPVVRAGPSRTGRCRRRWPRGRRRNPRA